MIEMNFTESFIKQQVKCLDILTELIAYDKQHGEPPENTRVLEAFIDTQRRALDLAGKLLEKHKPALEEAAKAEREKREAESKIKAAEAKEAQKKEQAKKDLENAKLMKTACFVTSLMKKPTQKLTNLQKMMKKLMTVTALRKITIKDGAVI